MAENCPDGRSGALCSRLSRFRLDALRHENPSLAYLVRRHLHKIHDEVVPDCFKVRDQPNEVCWRRVQHQHEPKATTRQAVRNPIPELREIARIP